MTPTEKRILAAARRLYKTAEWYWPSDSHKGVLEAEDKILGAWLKACAADAAARRKKVRK